jgi:hypothetical protein
MTPTPPAVTASEQPGAQPVTHRDAWMSAISDSLPLERAQAHVASLQRELLAVEQALVDREALTCALSG